MAFPKSYSVTSTVDNRCYKVTEDHSTFFIFMLFSSPLEKYSFKKSYYLLFKDFL